MPRRAEYKLVVSGSRQEAAPGATLSEPVSFQFLDIRRRPIQGLRVYFESAFWGNPIVYYGPDKLHPDTTTTDRFGMARVWVTLDTIPGRYLVGAQVIGHDNSWLGDAQTAEVFAVAVTVH
jgi:hypothetical protein